MNKIIYILLAMISIFAMEAQAKVATFTITFSEKDFTYEKSQYSETFISAEDLDTHYKENGEPCLPYFIKTVAMPGNYKYNSFTYSLTQTLLVKSNITLTNAPEVIPTSEISKTHAAKPANYEIKTYPSTNVQLTAVSQWSNLTVLHFVVYPYTYDAKNKSLLFSHRMTLNINYDIINKLPRNTTYTFTPSLLLQNYDYSFGFLPSDYQKEPEYGEDDIEYLIVTNEKLRSSFQPLADWKRKKGVRSKIITMEEILRMSSGNTIYNKIKYELYKYYKNYKLKYVLLGGDNVIVPSLPCYCEVDDYVKDKAIPCDLYYACFKGDFNWDANGNKIYGEIDDNVDFTPSLYVSRIPVTNATEAETFVNKTIAYEQNPKWKNQMLMAGVQIAMNVGKKSDVEHLADMLYKSAIQDNYNGELYKFFDTYTSETLDGSYDVTPENLKNVLSLGFDYIDMNTHGGIPHWDMEKNLNLTHPFYLNRKTQVHIAVITTV